MKNPCTTKFYISEKGYEGVHNFKYVGGSSSILYGCLWSPLCNWIVDHLIPDSIAPNTITLFASLQLIASHILVMIYSPLFDQEIPSSLCIWTGLSVLLYQILDNCDGKQARKTGSSSPLGMLFDHGCDSCITWVIILTLVNVMGLGQTSLAYFGVIFISQISFYMAQWSQYHIGVLKLGYINAIDEGLVAVEAILIFTGIFGQDIWHTQIQFLGDMQLNEVSLLGSIFGSIIQIILFIYDTTSNLEPGTPTSSIIPSLTCVFYLLFSYSMVYYVAPPLFMQTYGLYVHYAFAALFSKVTLQVQLAHLTKEDFKQMTFSYVFVTLFIITSFAFNKMVGDYNLDSAKIILIVTILMAFAAEIHMAVCVSVHISSILGIYVFSLKKQTPVQAFNDFNNHNHSHLQEDPSFNDHKEIEMYNRV